jgi:hypothetical protein
MAYTNEFSFVYSSPDNHVRMIFHEDAEIVRLAHTNPDNQLDINNQFISNGASENKSPLPLLDRMAQFFIHWQKLNYRYTDTFQAESFISEHNNAKKSEQNHLHFDEVNSYVLQDTAFVDQMTHVVADHFSMPLRQFVWGVNERIRYQDLRSKKTVEIPFVLEIINLLIVTAGFYRRHRFINRELKMAYDNFKQSFERLGINIPIFRDRYWVFNERIKHVSLTPLFLNTKEYRFTDTENQGFSLALASERPPGTIEFGWFELFFAHLHKMRLSLCTFCGTVYRFGRSNFTSSCCDKESCEAELRQQRPLYRRLLDPEAERMRTNLRAERYRKRRKAQILHREGMKMEDIAELLDISVEDISDWLK